MFFRQLRLLLWKNFVIRKRHPLRTVIEIVWPILLFSILIIVRAVRPAVEMAECHYPARALPSAGIFPWIETMFCNLDNPCFNVPVASETPGQINTPLNGTTGLTGGIRGVFDTIEKETTIFEDPAAFAKDVEVLSAMLQEIIKPDSIVKAPISSLLQDPGGTKSSIISIGLSDDLAETILQSQVTLSQILVLNSADDKSALVCNETALNSTITIPNTAPLNISQASSQLCDLSSSQLDSFWNVLVQNADFQQFLNNEGTDLLTEAGLNSGQNPADLALFVAFRFPILMDDLQTVMGSLGQLTSQLQSSNAGDGSEDSNMQFLNALIGYDIGTVEGFQQFCGHPEPNAQYGQQFLGQMFAILISLRDMPDDEFCTSFINLFETNEDLSFIWTVLKPILFGKIPFSPDTNVTRDIMGRANATFGAIAQMESLSNSWLVSLGPTVYDYLEDGPTVELFRTLLSSGVNLTGLVNVSESDLESLNIFLSNNETSNVPGTSTWKMLYSQLNFAVILIHKMLKCTNLDKFEGYPNEAALVERSMDLLANNSFWAGIVFLSPTEADTTLPKHIKYKIRQDVDDVMRTDFVEEYFWEPGPGTGIDRIRYLINGFADMQDMMEHGINRAASDAYGGSPQFYGAVPKLGYYLQQMPYPCYTSDNYWSAGPNANYSSWPFYYYTGGFLFVQDMLERGISSLTGNPTAPNGTFYPGVYLQEFPYPCYKSDQFLEYLGDMMSLLMTLAWIYSVCIVIKNIVYEKEQRLKEFMKMMGLGNGVHWIAWFINSFYLMLISSVLLVIVLNTGNVMPYSNPFIILLWLLCFSIATIAQCFLISCFFTKANLAAACGGIIYFMLYIPYNFAVAWEDELGYGGKIGLSFFSTVAFGYGAGFITNYEMTGVGMQFSNWNVNPVPGQDYTFVVSLYMMLVDALIYFLLTWFVENVYPGKYGIPRPVYFMFTKSYWFGTPSKPAVNLHGFANPNHDSPRHETTLEDEPSHLTLGVSVRNLTKIYSNGDKLAVDDLSLNFYEGHITSFLGHNGAGKTTTMSILCGLFTPSHGTAYVHGNDIRTDMDTIRTSLGMCPQHNVLFRDLTVEEHLNFYAGLRGATKKKIREGTDQMIIDVGLPHKRKEVVHNLSGGMKRKLSVAVAFIGDSKTVILDEPTAGVDPYARRGIWDLLLKYKQGRTIILSTHHMDEADLLGDRIAIISQGRLKCCGSSLFLKSTFGVGYYLTLVKQRAMKQNEVDTAAAPVLNIPAFEEMAAASEDEGFGSKPGSSKASSISGEKGLNEKPPLYLPPDGHLTLEEAENLVRSVVPNAQVNEENVREISFILPYDAIREGRYTMLFQALDSHNLTYGLTDTSLEEIFLSVADHAEEKPEPESKTCQCCDFLPGRKRHSSSSVAPSPYGTRKNKKNGPVELVNVRTVSSNTEDLPETTRVQIEEVEEEEEEQSIEEDSGLSGEGSYQLKGERLIAQQFLALMIKRYHHALRNRKGIFAQIILPSAFVLIALCFTLILPPYDGQPSLEMQPWLYGDYQSTFYSDDSVNSSASSSVADSLVDAPGLGTRCVTNYSIENFDDTFLSCVPVADGGWRTSTETKTLSQYADSTTFEECTCTTDDKRILLADCPNGAGGSPTPFSLTNTTDTVYNMTGRDVSDWLVKTTDRFIQKRYGGLSVGEKYHSSFDHATVDKFLDLLKEMNVSMANDDAISTFFENMWRTENAQVWFDNNGYHAMPAWLNVLSNGVLRSEIPVGGYASEYAVTLYNHPMNYTEAQVSQAALLQTATDTAIAVVVVFAMSFVPASFVIFLIDERITKAKHLQFISGVNQAIYWIANFAWDMVNYLIPAIIVIIIFLCFQTDAYVSARNLPALVLLLLLYGWSITPMMYPFSFVFQVPSTAYVVLTCINLFIGINTSIATLILQLLQDDAHLQYVNDILQKVFLIFPHYCLGRGLIDLAVNQATADAYAKFGIDSFVNPLSWDMTGKNLCAMAIEGFVFFGFNLLIQYKFFVRPRSNVVDARLMINDAMEEDVVAEKQRILSGDGSQSGDKDILRIENLSKVYQKLPLGKGLLAVDRMCVGVARGECFGLLGVNGAGKTTTFKVLTGDETATAGDATVRGISMRKDLRTVQQNTGYCPQFDALNAQLTGFEHLQLYARLRGIPKEEIDQVAQWGIAKLGLRQYAHKPAGTYSGGNKRKLSAAIAFIGCPPVIFLDEPTAGMDPRSRRFLWKRILEVIKVGDYNKGSERCVVLTSHSMEECEALCTRLAIMVNGRFMCLGAPQHLKNKYGKGYTVTLRVGGEESNLGGVQDLLLNAFPGAALKEKHHNMIVFQLPLEIVRLSEVFELIETHKASLHIDDYSVSQTTLDEVFINFAKLQTDGVEDEVAVRNAVTANHEMSQLSSQHKAVVV